MNHGRFHPARDRAFTLMELIVVVVVMAILAAIVLPTLSGLQRSGRVEATINSITNGVSSLRARSGAAVGDMHPQVPGARFGGAAGIFTSNELRLALHDQRAAADGGTDYLQMMSPPRYGFADMGDVDPFTFARGAGVVGLTRREDTGGVQLVPPPFAVRFDGHGRLVLGSTETRSQLVYYDGRGDGRYRTGSNRGNPHTGSNPETFDRHSPQFNSAHEGDHGRIIVPFDELETVFGVIVYPKADMLNQFTTFAPATGALRNEILERGQVVIFGRHAGAGLRTGGIE